MLIIHREKQPDKLIRLGHAPEVIQSEQSELADFSRILEDHPLRDEYLEIEAPNAPALEPPPVIQPENKRGRKKMAKEKDLEEVGTKTIRKDDAGEQGAIGTHGANAPAQEKVPEKSPDSKEGE